MIKLRNLFCFILTIVCFWYQISGTRNPATGTRNGYQILVPVFCYQFLVSMSWALHLFYIFIFYAKKNKHTKAINPKTP